MGAAAIGVVPGWELEIGELGPRTTSTATSTSGDGMVIWWMSLMPITDLAASVESETDVLLTFSVGEEGTIADVERRAVGGEWEHIGFSIYETGEYLDVNPGSGQWEYRARAAGTDGINLSRSEYGAIVQATVAP